MRRQAAQAGQIVGKRVLRQSGGPKDRRTLADLNEAYRTALFISTGFLLPNLPSF
jgi:hypothetical protein